MKRKYRYPFSPYPEGWYVLAESTAVPPGCTLGLEYFGRDIVLYRTIAGKAVAVDAHCPHMGAHLAVGGTVDDTGIRCPFHAWHFDASGWCTDVPYSKTGRVPKVRTAPWVLREHSGLIMTWWSEAGREPSWEPPERPEFQHSEWVGYELVEWTIRVHVQEIAENVPDTAHFTYVHEVGPDLLAEIEVDGHVYRQRSSAVVDGTPIEFTRQEASGLGLVWLHTGSDLWFLTATTPIDEERVHLRLYFLARDKSGTGVLDQDARAFIALIVENTSRDIPIWENKIYVERPPLIPDDGPIKPLRRWARQFYVEASAPPARDLETDGASGLVAEAH